MSDQADPWLYERLVKLENDENFRRDLKNVVWLQESVLVLWKGNRYYDTWHYPHCYICKCELCGRMQAERRLLTTSFYVDRDYDLYRVCIGCYNKVAAANRRYNEFCDTRAIINKLQKAITHARKSQHDGGSEVHAVEGAC